MTQTLTICVVTNWLAACQLEGLAEPLLKNKVTLEVMKFLKDTDLINMGIFPTFFLQE